MQEKFRSMFQQCRYAVSLMILFSAFALVIGCGGSSSEDTPLLPTQKTVVTAFGSVQGDTANDAWVWKGVPYAKPPVGALRWKAPVDPDAWTGVRQTTAACSECVQQVYDSHWFSQNVFIGNEDCLYLDIYAPRTASANLPVYVYIHGGSNNFGSAKQYDGSELAKRGNMIVVYVQYRLNAMGFLTHPSLRTSGTDSDKSGNYGMLDIMKALSWVQGNIAAFGGDPSRVVVGGQSAGAHNTMNLLTSPQPALFRGVFVQSVAGPGLMDLRTVAASDTWTNTTIDGLLIRDGVAADAAAAAAYRATMSNSMIEAYLRGKSAELIARCRRDGTGADGTGQMSMHSGIRDGVVVRDALWTAAIAAGNYHKVPVVNGGTRYEWKNFAPLYGGAVKTYTGGLVPSGAYSWLQLWNVIGILSPALTADTVMPLQADNELYEAITDLRSRQWRLTGVDDINRALKVNDPVNPVYGFVFKWAGGGDPERADFATYFGAGHGMEIPFFQGRPTDAWDYSFTAANQAGRVALQRAMMDYLISFVKTLNPNPAGSSLLAWPQWDPASGGSKVITFDATLTNYVMAVDTYEVIAADLNAEIAAAKLVYPYPMAWVVNGL